LDLGGVELFFELEKKAQVGVLNFVVFKHDEWLQQVLKNVVELSLFVKHVVDLLEYSYLITQIAHQKDHCE